MKRITVDELPSDPLAAGSMFQEHWLSRIEHILESGEDALVAVSPAEHSHHEWRRTMAVGLARKYTPRRCNIVAGETAAIGALEHYLRAAPGITGQYLECDDAGAAGDPA